AARGRLHGPLCRGGRARPRPDRASNGRAAAAPGPPTGSGNGSGRRDELARPVAGRGTEAMCRRSRPPAHLPGRDYWTIWTILAAPVSLSYTTSYQSPTRRTRTTEAEA